MRRESKFKTFLWYSSVGLLVIFAVAVSLFRLYFSSVEEYRGQLEKMAGDYLGQPVTIGKMDARVVGFSPTVILSDVSLLQKDGKQLLTRFDAIDITLDAVASLGNFAPIIELTISGANLEVSRNPDGTFGVQGLELAQKKGPEDEAETRPVSETGIALGNWFLSQNRLALKQSNIILYDRKNDDRLSFRDVELELRNDGERHRLNGFVHLPESIGRELRVAVDITGNLLQGKAWSGLFYLKTEQLRPREWLQQIDWKGSAIRDGVFDLELWSSWKEGGLESVTTRLKAEGVELSRGDHHQIFPELGLKALLTRPPNGWRVEVAKLNLRHSEAKPKPMRLELFYGEEAKVLRADRLDLKALGVLLPYLPMLSEQQEEMVRTIAPSGMVENLHVQLLPGQRVIAQGQLRDLAARPWEKLPGASGISALFRIDGDNGQLQLTSEQGELMLPQLFRAPLKLGHVESDIALSREEGAWHLLGSGISLANENVSARLNLELRLQQGEKPWLSLQGRFSAKDARAVPEYLPAGKLKEKSLYWLDNAFKGGNVPSGSLQFHGSTGDFPFRNHDGRFEVLFDAEAVQLHYQDGWPDLHQLSGEVHFDGPGMWIHANGARLFDARLGRTKVSIENLKLARLLVDGGGVLSIDDGLRFLRDSPLSKHTGKSLDAMHGSGKASLALHLAIPISPKIRETLPLQVRGKVDFNDNTLDVLEGVSASKLSGTLEFTEKSFDAEALTAELYGKPATITVHSEGGERPKVVVVASGRAELARMQDSLDISVLDYLQGETAWRATLEIPRGDATEGSVLHIRSDLVGVNSTLPRPLQKERFTLQNMRLSFHLGGMRTGETQLTLSNDFGVVWRMQGEGEERRLRRAQIRLGDAASLKLPDHDQIEVLGRGGDIALKPWLDVLDTIRGEGEGNGKHREPLPLRIAMTQLHLLNPPREEAGGEEEQTASGTWPPLDIAIDDFTYNDMPLGKVSLRGVPQDERFALKDITLGSERYSMIASGEWKADGNTFFDYEVKTEDLGELLKQLGFASVIKGGKGSSNGKLWWSGAPTQVSFARLNGQVAISIKEGTIVDVDPGAGRMLGILSIPALPRRLFLDFSDVFKKGFAFDSIKGDIRIEQGQAYTTNLQLESVPADILITGRTGLDKQDFDQEVYVVPNVRDTATVASALAWGPQVAAVVALFQEAFKSNINAATMSRYHITGSWRDPRIRRVEENNQETEQPKQEEDLLFLE